MRKNNAIAILAVYILGSLVLEGCKKREDQRFDSSTNNSEAVSVFDDVYKVVAEAVEGEPGATSSTWSIPSISCATVSVTPVGSEFPKTVTIDFGEGCTSNRRFRSGQIVCEISGLYRAENTEVMVDLIDYNLDVYEVSRHHMLITNNGLNGNGHPVFSIEVHNASIADSNGTSSWSSTQTRTWVEGSETTWYTPIPDTNLVLGIDGLYDDVYHIEGTATGTTRGGVPYTVDITAPLEVQTGCRWVKAGTLVVSPQNLDDRTIDFGNGDCDEGASVEIDGNSYNFTMW